ncbi:MAG: hypothetical protein JSR87_14640 [Proteobacteria bacterium]|nr:hypothetical protein [Pseudomonadota bacterium]MBS0574504.1 hypothetical protein [Pseudomonadota bacterium]
MLPLIHPGYHKTGTTWMQRRLFLPEHGFASLFSHEDIDALIFQPGPFSFDAGRVTALAEERHDRLGRHLVPVISSEILSGQPYIGGRDCRMIADRLKETFPEAMVIVTIREQLALLPSLYMQYLQAGGTLSHQRFFAGRSVIGNYGFDPAFWDYDRFVGHYAALFGRDRMIVHPMEVLIRHPAAIVEKLNRLTGAGTDAARVDFSNATYGARESVVPLIRRINHVRRNDFGFGTIVDLGRLGTLAYRAANKFSRSDLAARLGVTGKPVTRHVAERFADRFAASNTALQEFVTEDLVGLGYPLAR